MTTVALSTTPATLDPGTAYELDVVNSGSTIAHVQIAGGLIFDQRVNPGQTIRVQPNGQAVTAFARSGSGQVTTTSYTNPEASPSGAFLSVGPTNIDAANYGDDIQAALNALPAGGGKVWLNKPSYTLTAGIVCTKPNVELIGVGGHGQDTTVGAGATQILVPAGAVGFKFGLPSSSMYQGVHLRNLHIRDANPGAATGGIWIANQDNFVIQDVTVSGFSGASSYGVLLDGSGALSQYGTCRELRANNCKVGVKITSAGGIRFFGGMLDGNSNSGTVIAGTTAVSISGGGVHRFFGTVIQFWDTLMDLQAGSDYTELHGCRFEVFITRAIRIASNYVQMYGGTINNYLGGGGGIGVDVLSGATASRLMPNAIEAVATQIQNSGTNTFRHFATGEQILGSAGYLQVGSGATLKASGANAKIEGANGLILDRFLVTGNANNAEGVYLGGIQDTLISRKATKVGGVGTDTCWRTGLAATASRPSASTAGQGSQFFDTTLQKPIWSDGTNWRDAAGTVV